MPQDVKDLPSYAESILKPRIHELYPTSAKIVKDLPEFTPPDSDHQIFNDYIINVVYDRYALKGRAYSILFYLGEPTQPFCNSKADPHFVGQIYTFSKPYVQKGTVTCANCQKQSEVNKLSRAQIPLTLPLLRRVSLDLDNNLGLPIGPSVGYLATKDVETVLQHRLKWYFIEAGGVLRNYEDFPPSTQVTVLQGEGRHPTDGKIFPSFGNYKILEEATKERPLGFGNPIGRNDLTVSDPQFL